MSNRLRAFWWNTGQREGHRQYLPLALLPGIVVVLGNGPDHVIEQAEKDLIE